MAESDTNTAATPAPTAAARVIDFVKTLGRPRTYRTIGRELAGFAVAIGAYPMGVLDEAIEAAPLLEHTVNPLRNPRFHLAPGAYDVPIVLVHGYAHNRSGYWLLKSRLHAAGFRHVFTLNYNPWVHDIPLAAQRLQRRIEMVRKATGAPYVHVVGHSMGGLVGRYYVQCLGGGETTLRLITIGSPHAGTHAANLASMLGRTARQLGWQSPLIRMLNTVPVDKRVRMTSIYSSTDELVIPAESARLCPTTFNSENIHLPGEGHMSLLMSTKVMNLIIERLGDLEGLGHLTAPAKRPAAAPVAAGAGI